jgi:UDP-glucose:(heptosyl)LPS alpha-1,3-glucosyltransferase
MRDITLVAHAVTRDGGQERVAQELVREWLALGAQVTVVAIECDLAAHPRLRFVRVPLPRRPAAVTAPAFFVLAAVALWRLPATTRVSIGPIVPNKVDVVSAHWCHSAYARNVGTSRARNGRLLFRLNSLLASRWSRLSEAFVYRPRARTGARHVVPVSRGLRRELVQEYSMAATHSTVIENAVNIDEFRPDPEARDRIRAELGIKPSAPVAIFAGGDWSRKGLALAIAALVRAPAWRLIVAGRGDPAGFEASALHLGVRDRIHFVGFQDTVRDYYAAADLLVLPSEYEAFVLALLEAAACHVPAVVPRMSGSEDFVVDGVTGFFAERDASAIAGVLNRAAEDLGGLLSMGAAAAARVQSKSWRSVAEHHLALYETLARAEDSTLDGG